VSFLALQHRLPEAEEICRKIAKLGENDAFYRSYLARFYVSSNQGDKAITEYQRILSSYPDDIVNRRAAATLYTSLGRANDAQQMIDIVLKQKPGDTQILLVRAQVRMAQNRIEEAIQDLQRFVSAEPKSAFAHYLMAEAYTRQGNTNQAESELRTATQISPKMVQPRMMLGALEMSQGHMAEAESDLGNVVSEKPDFVTPYVMHSMVLASEGHLEQAERDLLPKIDQFPQPGPQSLTYRSLGWIKLSQRKPSEAQQYAAKSYALDPNSRDSLYLLGLTYFPLNKIDAGLAVIRAKADARPDWAPGYEVLGKLSLLARHYPEAESALRKAITIDPNSSLAQMELGEAALSQNKLDDAIAIYSKLVEKQPKLMQPNLLIGQIYESKGTPTKAIPYYQKVLELEPDNAVAKNNLAWIYSEYGGNIDVALHLAEEAKGARPDDPSIADTLAWIYVKKKNFDPAIRLLRTNVSKNPNDAVYKYHLGMAYYYSGDKADARETLQAALKLKPDSPQAAEEKQILEALKN
jgi:tetratricopeptide (TPR) repeat protein